MSSKFKRFFFYKINFGPRITEDKRPKNQEWQQSLVCTAMQMNNYVTPVLIESIKDSKGQNVLFLSSMHKTSVFYKG